MPARVTELSDAQRATFTPFVREWVERASRIGPLTEADRAAVVDGIRACYALAGRPWHGNVAWVGSPYTGARAAALAAAKIAASRRATPGETPPAPHSIRDGQPPSNASRPAARRRQEVLFAAFIGLGGGAAFGAALGALVGGTAAATRAYIHVGGAAAIAGAAIAGGFAVVAALTGLADRDIGWRPVVLSTLGVALFTVLGAAIGARYAGETIPFPGAAVVATGRAWATILALIGPVAGAALAGAAAAGGTVAPPAPSAVPPPQPPPADATADELRRAIVVATLMAVEAAVDPAVWAEVVEHVQRPIRAATGVVPAAVDKLIASIEYGDLDDDFGEVPARHEVDAVAVRIAYGAPPTPVPVRPADGVARCAKYTKMPGFAAADLAAAVWLRDHDGLELPGDLWSRADAYLAANRAGPWWATADFAIVSEPPVERYLDADGAPHRAGGPALRWSDGLTGWFIHGEPDYRPGRALGVGGSDF